jgi:hypothetical protein
VIQRPPVDWFALSPVLALLGASGIALLAAVLVPQRARKAFAAIVTAAGYLGALVAAVWIYVDSKHGHPVIADALYRDRWAALAAVIICAIGLAAVAVSWGERPRARGWSSSWVPGT